MNKALLLFALLIHSSLLFSQNNYGLRFKSKEVIKKDRTGIDLTKNGSIKYNSSFEIKFDLSFREYVGFGYIFRLKELKSNNQIDLICKSDDFSFGLYLVSNKRETEAQISLEEILKHPRNEWNELKAKFNTDSGTLELCFIGDKITETINFPTESEFVLAFGVVENYQFDTKEVPYISIRNIEIKTDENNVHFWPLNNFKGNETFDTINDKIAEITNPEWEIYHHAKWKLIKKERLNEKTQAVYDPNKEIVYLIGNNNKIYYFDLNSTTFDSITYTGLAPVYENDNQVIINDKSELLAYSHQEKVVSKFNFEEKKWTPQLENHDSLPKYWHHNKLINPVDSSVVTICGYGFYKYSNQILTFEERQNNWDTICFKGDTLYPRYLSSLGQNSKNKNQYYLFGGLGNKSGDQILGTEFYYDLYLIDFSDSSITRKWQFFSQEDNFTPVNSLYVDENGKNFYTLCFSHHDEKTYLRVFRAAIEKPDYSFIADSIPYYFLDILSFADMYYWASARKLVAITLSSTDETNFDVNIYTLKFPPGSITEAESEKGVISKLISFEIMLMAGTILLLLVGLVVYLKKQKRNKELIVTKEEPSDLSHLITKRIQAAENQPNSINLFGGFQVFDKKGKDITYRFSPTLKELFLLLLLHSHRSSKGVSSLKIQEILWPDKPSASAKNNRGVNIKKLRTVLPDIGDIHVNYESPYWKLELRKEIVCDYYFINAFLNNQTGVEPENLETYYQFLSYLKRGNMLSNIETEWLDNFKSEISTKIVQFLEQKLSKADFKQDAVFILETADIISQFDQLNETALNYKCKVLNCLGEHGLAINAYNSYTKLYQHAYGEEYKTPFKEIIKAN